MFYTLDLKSCFYLPIIKPVRGDRGSVTLCPFACLFYIRPSKATLSTPSFGLCRIWDKTGQSQEKLLVSNIWLFYSFHRLFIKTGKYNNNLSMFQTLRYPIIRTLWALINMSSPTKSRVGRPNSWPLLWAIFRFVNITLLY